MTWAENIRAEVANEFREAQRKRYGVFAVSAEEPSELAAPTLKEQFKAIVTKKRRIVRERLGIR